MCNDHQSSDLCVDDAKRSLTLLHLAPSFTQDLQLQEHRSESIVLLPSPPRSGGSWLEEPEPNLPFPSGSWCLPPSRPCRVSGRLRPPGPLTVPSRCLPLCFGHARSRCRLSGAHCHSISTTRLSFTSQAETLAISQSDVAIHKNQPITATL